MTHILEPPFEATFLESRVSYMEWQHTEEEDMDDSYWVKMFSDHLQRMICAEAVYGERVNPEVNEFITNRKQY